MRILVIIFRNIGDALLSTPLIKNLKLNYPNSELHVALNSYTTEVFSSNSSIDQLIEYKREEIKNSSLLKRLIMELSFISKFVNAKYDIVINLTSGDRGALISLLSNSRISVGFNKKPIFNKVYSINLPPQKNLHTVDFYLNALDKLKLKTYSKEVDIFWNKEDEKKVEALKIKNGFIHIHPVSRWLFKCLDDNLIARIIDFFEIELNRKVVITSAPIVKEIEKNNKILSLCSSCPTNLSGLLSLNELAYLNSRSSLFLGVDTAVMHISAANNIPTIAFFGPSGANNWGPWDNSLFKNGYTQKNGIQKMGRHVVISESRGCQPCGKDGCNGSKISECLTNIEFDSIKRVILAKIS